MERQSVFGNLFNDTRERALKRVYNPKNDAKYESRKKELNSKLNTNKSKVDSAYVLK